MRCVNHIHNVHNIIHEHLHIIIRWQNGRKPHHLNYINIYLGASRLGKYRGYGPTYHTMLIYSLVSAQQTNLFVCDG